MIRKIRKIIIISLLSTNVYAHDIAIEVGNFRCFPSQYCDVYAKYYQRFVNDTDQLKNYCYAISLCVDGYGCGKGLSECVDVDPHKERLIGKELHFNRTYDVPNQCLMIKARSMINGTQIDEKQSQLCIWGG